MARCEDRVAEAASPFLAGVDNTWIVVELHRDGLRLTVIDPGAGLDVTGFAARKGAAWFANDLLQSAAGVDLGGCPAIGHLNCSVS